MLQISAKRTFLQLLLLPFLLLTAATPAFARFQPVSCRNSFTPQQEISEGNKVVLEVYKQMPVLPDNDPVSRYVQQLGMQLVQQAPLVPGVTQQWPFQFHVVASSDINAFALPGGAIFVNLGTIQAADTEAQLAGVIAHEISHVVMRHSTCNLAKQQKEGIGFSLGAIVSQILLGNGTAGQLSQAAIGGVESVTFLRMSRTDEQQADLLGVNILNDSNYDPRGLPQFFEIIQTRYGSGGAQFLSDHPNPGNRTQYVNAEIATLQVHDRPIVRTARFTDIHAQAAQRRAVSAADVKSGAWKQSGAYASQPGANANAPYQASYPNQNQNGNQYPNQNQPSPTQSQNRDTPGYNQPGQQQPNQQQQSAQTITPLTRTQLGFRDPRVLIQAQRFSINAPRSWQQTTDDKGVLTLAPAGGNGQFGLAYGALIGVEQQNGDGASAQNLSAVTASIVQRFTAQGSNVTQTGSVQSLTLAGLPANMVELRGLSPVAVRGQQLAERDLLVTFARPDGDVTYLVLVSPTRDAATLKPLFNSMLNSFRPQ